MAEAVYILGTLVAAACAVLLLQGYARRRRSLLLWSGLCFAGLAVTNLLVLLDLIILPESIDLYPLRLAVTGVSMALLLFGLIWESQS